MNKLNPREIFEHINATNKYNEYECPVHGYYMIRKDEEDQSCPYKKYHEEEESTLPQRLWKRTVR